MDQPKLDLRRIRYWLPPMLLTLVPFVLVLREPDLGTSLSFPVMLIAMYFWAGMPLSTLVLGLSPALNVVLFFATGSLWWFVAVMLGILAIIRPRPSVLVLVLLVNGAVAYGLPTDVESAARLPETSHRNVPESGAGSARRGLPDHSVERSPSAPAV